MLVYSYSEKTKEFIGMETAEADREATKRTGNFVPLIPANATLLKPPTETGKTAVFENGKWVLKNDYRGQLAIDPLTDEIEEIDYIGELKSGHLFYKEYIKTDEYKEKQEALKIARIQNLAMKPIDFVNAVEKIGVKYEDLLAYCDENKEMDKYLRFSDVIKRGDEILDKFLIKFNITSEVMDKIFKDYGG